jgi:hypothetical protein
MTLTVSSFDGQVRLCRWAPDDSVKNIKSAKTLKTIRTAEDVKNAKAGGSGMSSRDFAHLW